LPERDTVSGLLGSLLVTTRDESWDPTAEGEKVTDMPQEALMAREAPQVVVRLKSAAPGLATDREVHEAVPVLVTLTGWAVLVAPTGMSTNWSPPGKRVMLQAVETVALTWLELALVPAELKALTT
jgi:hypothetical protein